MFVVGTRGSRLALAQTHLVLGELRALNPDASFEVHTIQTSGDHSAASLSEMGGRGVFVIEIERAVLSGEIDIAVHSLKDLPSEETPGLSIAAVPPREDVRDVLVARGGVSFAELPEGAVIGTGSPRRAAQVKALRPDLEMKDIRGNVETRIRKADEGEYHAVVLAAAGLKRMGLFERASHIFEAGQVLPAVGQAALAIQCRADDNEAIVAVAGLDDGPTRAAVTAERAFERTLGAGCNAPIAAYGTVGKGWSAGRAPLLLRGLVGDPANGGVRGEMEGVASEADMLGMRLAEFLIAQGAADILGAAK
jgi:hydroxymethylbilane synthase